MKSRPEVPARAGSAAKLILLLAAGLIVSACGTGPVLPQTTIWEATLSGTPAEPSIQGQAAAISRASGMEMGIEVEGLTPDAKYMWAIRRGTCNAGGDLVGTPDDYPPLVSASGIVSRETTSGHRLIAGNPYHVELRRDDTGGRAACGDFAQL